MGKGLSEEHGTAEELAWRACVIEDFKMLRDRTQRMEILLVIVFPFLIVFLVFLLSEVLRLRV